MTESSPIESRSPLPQQTSQTRPPEVESDPTGEPSGSVRTAAEPAYSIRLAANAGTPCPLCGAATGSGPVGYHGDQAICDLCLLEGSNELGMVLALVAVVRAYGSVEQASSDERRDALNELGAFARIYERFAAKSGPARMFLPRLFIH